jgi:hypothetical protein
VLFRDSVGNFPGPAGVNTRAWNRCTPKSRVRSHSLSLTVLPCDTLRIVLAVDITLSICGSGDRRVLKALSTGAFEFDQPRVLSRMVKMRRCCAECGWSDSGECVVTSIDAATAEEYTSLVAQITTCLDDTTAEKTGCATGAFSLPALCGC